MVFTYLKGCCIINLLNWYKYSDTPYCNTMPCTSIWWETKPSISKSHKKSKSFCFRPHLQVIRRQVILIQLLTFFSYKYIFNFFFLFSISSERLTEKCSNLELKNYLRWYSLLWKIWKQFRSLVICMCFPWHCGAPQ